MECDTCTLCCTLCAVEDIRKEAGEKCKYCADKCTIYKDRPSGCRAFNCAYAQMKEVNIALRPDKCGVVFEKMSDTQVLGMLDPTREEYPYAKKQVDLFKKAGYEVVITQNGKVIWQ